MVYGDYIVEQDVLCVVLLSMENILLKKTCCVLCMVHGDHTVGKYVLCVVV